MQWPEMREPGEEAIQQALAEPTDLILMDVNLGAGIDGIEAARKNSLTKKYSHRFVTAYTGEAAVAKIKAAPPGCCYRRQS